MLLSKLTPSCFHRDSSPGTPTFGGGAQSNSIFRDGSLYKDGSITSCLQAAFQAQMEEEEHLEDQQVRPVDLSTSCIQRHMVEEVSWSLKHGQTC